MQPKPDCQFPVHDGLETNNMITNDPEAVRRRAASHVMGMVPNTYLRTIIKNIG